MKQVTCLLFILGIVLISNKANAQSSLSSATGKDEYWGTSKSETRGSSTAAVDVRARGLDTRYNTYEGGQRSSFSKKKIAKSKRMKEILKKEEKMMKKRRKDKRRLRRSGL